MPPDAGSILETRDVLFRHRRRLFAPRRPLDEGAPWDGVVQCPGTVHASTPSDGSVVPMAPPLAHNHLAVRVRGDKLSCAVWNMHDAGHPDFETENSNLLEWNGRPQRQCPCGRHSPPPLLFAFSLQSVIR